MHTFVNNICKTFLENIIQLCTLPKVVRVVIYFFLIVEFEEKAVDESSQLNIYDLFFCSCPSLHKGISNVQSSLKNSFTGYGTLNWKTFLLFSSLMLDK